MSEERRVDPVRSQDLSRRRGGVDSVTKTDEKMHAVNNPPTELRSERIEETSENQQKIAIPGGNTRINTGSSYK